MGNKFNSEDFIIGIGLGGGFSGLVVVFFTVVLPQIDIPDVLVSHTTNECVHVVNYRPEDKYTCENLPEKYNRVWVR